MLADEDLNAIAARVVERLLPLLGGVPAERLLTKSELAAHLRVEPAQIDRFVRKGMPREIVGARSRFRLGAVEDWLAKNAKPRTVPAPPVSQVAQPAAAGRLPAGITPIGAGRGRRTG